MPGEQGGAVAANPTMKDDGYLLLIASRCTEAERRAAWDTWACEELLPALQAAGADEAARFALRIGPGGGGSTPGFSHLEIYEFRGADAEARLDATLGRLATLREEGVLPPWHAIPSVETLVAHGSGGRKSQPAGDLEGHILAWVMPTDPQRHADWDRWYDEVHLPDMQACGAFRAVSRWRRREPIAFQANDLTLYDVAGLSIDDAVQKSAAILPALKARGRKHECHAGALVYEVAWSPRRAGETHENVTNR